VVRVADLADDETLQLRVDRALVHHNALRAGLGMEPIDREVIWPACAKSPPRS
jgi:adenylosuccinate synthase